MAALAPIAAFASAAAPYAALAGAGITAAGTIAAGNQTAAIGAMERDRLQAEGKAAKQAAEYQAAQLEVRAKDERAAAQREADQYQRQKKLALSKLTTRAAAGGFSATDPTTLALADEIEEYGTLQEQIARYGGESRAAGARAQAEASIYSGTTAYRSAISQGDVAYATGQAKRDASYLSAAGTILGGIGQFGNTMYSRYRDRQPSAGYRYG